VRVECDSTLNHSASFTKWLTCLLGVLPHETEQPQNNVTHVTAHAWTHIQRWRDAGLQHRNTKAAQK